MFLTNLKVYLKFLGRNRVYSLVTVAGFSVSLMFVVVLGVYVKQELSVDRFHEKGDRIYFATNSKEGTMIGAYANPVAPWLRDTYPDAESFARVYSTELSIERPDGEVVDASGMLADSTFFNIFSFPLVEGTPSEALATKSSLAVSRSFAINIFGAENPMGQSLTMSGHNFEVTGVFADFPKNTVFRAPEFIANYNMVDEIHGYEVLDTYNNSSFTFFVLEREGGDIRSKEADVFEKLKGVSWFFEEGFADKVTFVPLEELYFTPMTVFAIQLGSNDTDRVALYLIVVILILVVALLNYINMTVAQAGFRGKEVALKKLHGAGSGSIVVQMLTESLVVTLISFVAGLFMAFAMEHFFNNVLNTRLDLAQQFTAPMIAAIVGLVVFIAVASGVIPALVMSGFKPLEVIKGTFSRRMKGVWSRVLAVFQYAVSIALLICCAFVVLQSKYLENRDVGLERDGVVLMQNTVHGDTGRLSALKDMLSDIPGVEAVSMMARNPFNSVGGNNSMQYNGEALSFERFDVDTTFFRLFDLAVEPTGNEQTNTRGETLYRLYLNRAGYTAVDAAEKNNTMEPWGGANVNGVVGDFNFRSLHSTQFQGLIMMHVFDEMSWAGVIGVKLSAEGDPIATLDRVKAEYEAFSGEDRYTVEWADDTIRAFYEQERCTSRIMMIFAALAILVMLMGIFAMSIYVLRQREKEIAVRKVNGSTIGEILVLLGRQSLLSAAIAFVVACPVAWWAMSRWLQGFAYRTTLNPLVFVAAGALVLALSFLCTGWQSLKAARRNPVESLKSE